MKSTSSMFFGAGLLLLTAGVASAQDGDRPKGGPKGPGGPGGGPGPGGLVEFLSKADSNNDGKLSKEEFGAVSKRDTDERFARMDGNGDGFVDKAEIGQIAERMRGMAGRGRPDGAPGGDGGFRRPPEGGKPKGDRPPEGGPPGGDRRPGGPGGPGGMNPEEIFGRMDADGDGNVTAKEYRKFAIQESEERFKRLDGDEDGTVSKSEFTEVMAKFRQMMGGGRPGQGGPGAGRGGPPKGGDDRGGFRRPPEADSGKERPALEDSDDA